MKIKDQEALLKAVAEVVAIKMHVSSLGGGIDALYTMEDDGGLFLALAELGFVYDRVYAASRE